MGLPHWGRSFLTVESVQELVKTQKETIPERYIRGNEERQSPISLSDHQLHIPIIDMSKLPEESHREQEIKKIAQACEEWGFFQVVNHGIPKSLIDGVKRVGKEFFQLPLEEKQMYSVKPGDLQGYGQIFVVSEEQKLDWGDLLVLITSPPHYRDLNLWPLQPTDFRSFLTVESVQELVKTQKETIPERYIRGDEERQSPISLSDHQLHIPIIDMSKLSEESEREQEIKKIAQACEEWGFFQVVNHGIPKSLIDGVKRVGKEFFQLPLEEKQMYSVKPGDLQGYGQTFVVSEEQKLDWGDLLGLITSPPHYRDFNMWPVQPTDFREIVDAYSNEIKSLAAKLLSLIAETLDLKHDYLEKKFGKPYLKMRMNYYPQCPRPDHVFGLSPHADMTGITLLLQDDEVIGLNVRKDDQWISVQPISYALVINIGNLIEVMTNGRYKSIEHRAMTNRFRARMSIGFFYAPEFEAEIGPALELIDQTHPCLFRNFIHADYIKEYFSRGVEGKHALYEYAGMESSQT